ncbi:M24 family metallopeptidase [Robertkochia solimangrovi]|uniref:M24 family metallopeptidase n=1 Tax=Robertkochia solimangrovi TaxID=2213046 RepID=UPI0011816F43|nr:Xaa-Pro peptidase family protein [Robertkochia solimangrovi]TRZ46249.1 aminopeptidase P family protein [Robertkochia solimangrovi]
MNLKNSCYSFVFLCLGCFTAVIAQEKHYYQTDFPPEEFQARRNRIFDEIGDNAIALIQSAPTVAGFKVFRQSNTFYYLCGIEEGHAYLLLNGKNRTTTLYLPHRDEGRERSQGKILSAEDTELVSTLTGIDRLRPVEYLGNDLVGTGLIKGSTPVLYTPLSPAETGNDSRDEILGGHARAAADPWDSQITREAQFKQLLNERFPEFEIKDLSPLLDSMRLIKSQREIEVIRKATQIAGLAIIEAMRSTKPGIYEYQLDAAAKFIFYQHGAQGDGYPAIIGGGANAFMGHYFRKTDALKNGDLVIMDYAPDYHNYTSDVTRIWPVNGTFNKEQTALYNFIVAYRDALFRYLKPGVTSDEVLDSAAADMEKYLEGKEFKNPNHLKAVREGIKFRGHFQHPVGMAVHDVGQVRRVPLEPGMVFTIDPMIWIPEERLYIRIEDVAVITETGVENLSAFVPSSIEQVQSTIKEKGLTEFRPAETLPLKKP